VRAYNIDDTGHMDEPTARLFRASLQLQEAASAMRIYLYGQPLFQDHTASGMIDSVRRAIQEWEVAVREYQSETNTPTP